MAEKEYFIDDRCIIPDYIKKCQPRNLTMKLHVLKPKLILFHSHMYMPVGLTKNSAQNPYTQAFA